MRLTRLLFASFPLLVLPALACGGSTFSASGGSSGTGGTTGTGGGSTTGTGTGGTGSGGGTTTTKKSPCPKSPAPGTACTIPNLACSYGDDVRAECREVDTCTGGVWVADHTACPPQSPACPSSPPPNKSSCSLDAGSHRLLRVPQRGRLRLLRRARRGGGLCMVGPPEWYCGSPMGPAACPAITPNEGTTCSDAGLICSYPSGCGLTASCTGGLWTWTMSACPG